MFKIPRKCLALILLFVQVSVQHGQTNCTKYQSNKVKERYQSCFQKNIPQNEFGQQNLNGQEICHIINQVR